jgi:hypothetical protein
MPLEVARWNGRIEISFAGDRAWSVFLTAPEQVDALVTELKRLKEGLWPKPLKPLCPASRELLAYLRQHQNITPIKAREELGIEHLPRRIKDLKEHGHRIKTIRKRGYAGKLYGRYELEGGA